MLPLENPEAIYESALNDEQSAELVKVMPLCHQPNVTVFNPSRPRENVKGERLAAHIGLSLPGEIRELIASFRRRPKQEVLLGY